MKTSYSRTELLVLELLAKIPKVRHKNKSEKNGTTTVLDLM